MPSFFDRERTVAPPGYSRWLVPPAALSIHLAIGQAYAFSVFNIPLGRLVGVTRSAPGDWSPDAVTWVFKIACAMLGLSAFLFGTWVERVGPRKTMFASALCFGGGFLVAAAGVFTHHIALLYLGYGVIGGVGLGLGYIAPVSTLIKWFPDRPGMATGMAIMGFGGGALIGSPLATQLMERFHTETSTGVGETFVTMGTVYFLFMLFGVFTVRVPASGWVPEGFARPAASRTAPGGVSVAARQAIKTPQFWLLWAVLFLNVRAGIGVLAVASPMIQETFAGRIGPAEAAGFVGLLSSFNLAGRFGWSSLSDRIGRKATYAIFFALGAGLYVLSPRAGATGNVALFIACFAVILSMYGGSFATVPAYLRDLFGVHQVGAIHGRLLTAWSAAAIVGPSLMTSFREAQLARGVPSTEVYSLTLYVMAGLLVVGLGCNAAIRPVHARHHLPG